MHNCHGNNDGKTKWRSHGLLYRGRILNVKITDDVFKISIFTNISKTKLYVIIVRSNGCIFAHATAQRTEAL